MEAQLGQGVFTMILCRATSLRLCFPAQKGLMCLRRPGIRQLWSVHLLSLLPKKNCKQHPWPPSEPLHKPLMLPEMPSPAFGFRTRLGLWIQISSLRFSDSVARASHFTCPIIYFLIAKMVSVIDPASQHCYNV